MRSSHLLTGLAALMVLQASHASTVGTTTYNIRQPGMSMLNTGNSFAAAFDTTLFHTPGVNVISQATLTLNFIGSNERTFVDSNTVTTIDGVWRRDTTSTYDDSLDSIDVSLTGHSGTALRLDDRAGFYSSNVQTSIQTSWRTVCGTFGLGCHDVVDGYVLAHDQTSGYGGTFAFTSPLGNTALAALNNGGLLRYGYTVMGGGVALDSAALNLTVSAVPEPAVAGMWLAGLGVLLGMRKFRRKAE